MIRPPAHIRHDIPTHPKLYYQTVIFTDHPIILISKLAESSIPLDEPLLMVFGQSRAREAK